MDMTGEYRIPAPRQRVWEALNDPEILKAAIPGCEELNKLSDHELDARVRAKVGPVSATFTGKVTLNDLNPPISYRIAGEGKGGAAGFAKGGAEVNLSEDGTDTILRYTAKADVGGKLAQIGSRLIQGTARKMADDFFGKFSTIVADQHAAEAPPPTLPAAAAPVGPAEPVVPAEVVAPAPAAPIPPVPPPVSKPVAFQPERPRAPATTATPLPAAKSGQPWYVWLIGAIIVVIVLFWLLGLLG
ncbi:MAG: SRPBCC family protein [Geminicoccaceae bacterium]